MQDKAKGLEELNNHYQALLKKYSDELASEEEKLERQWQRSVLSVLSSTKNELISVFKLVLNKQQLQLLRSHPVIQEIYLTAYKQDPTKNHFIVIKESILEYLEREDSITDKEFDMFNDVILEMEKYMNHIIHYLKSDRSVATYEQAKERAKDYYPKNQPSTNNTQEIDVATIEHQRRLHERQAQQNQLLHEQHLREQRGVDGNFFTGGNGAGYGNALKRR